MSEEPQLKQVIRIFDDGSVSMLEGEELAKWVNNCTSETLFCVLHGMNIWEKNPVIWKDIKLNEKENQ